jgi:hypothetical protein
VLSLLKHERIVPAPRDRHFWSIFDLSAHTFLAVIPAFAGMTD